MVLNDESPQKRKNTVAWASTPNRVVFAQGGYKEVI